MHSHQHNLRWWWRFAILPYTILIVITIIINVSCLQKHFVIGKFLSQCIVHAQNLFVMIIYIYSYIDNNHLWILLISNSILLIYIYIMIVFYTYQQCMPILLLLFCLFNSHMANFVMISSHVIFIRSMDNLGCEREWLTATTINNVCLATMMTIIMITIIIISI